MKRILIGLIAASAAVWPQASEAFQVEGDYPTGELAVKVWLNEANGSIYKPGRDVSVYFQASRDCYAVVYNVDTQGFVNVLFPKSYENSWVQGDRIYRIPGPEDGYDLIVDGPKGIEYVVAVASPYQLDVGALYPDAEPVDSDGFSFSGRITGDPEQAIFEVNGLLAWGDADYAPAGYASDVGWFYVGHKVPYPRYMVHTWYPDYYLDPYWDPYVHVGLFVDFHWGHDWCRPWWWRHGHRPHHDYWYVDHHGGKKQSWNFHIIREKHKSGWDDYHPVVRTKAPRYVERDRREDWDGSGRIKDTRYHEQSSDPDRVQDTRPAHFLARSGPLAGALLGLPVVVSHEEAAAEIPPQFVEDVRQLAHVPVAVLVPVMDTPQHVQ